MDCGAVQAVERMVGAAGASAEERHKGRPNSEAQQAVISLRYLGQVLHNTSTCVCDVARSPKSSQPSPCINLEVVRKGGTILYCDYVCENLNDAEQLSWLLVNHTEEIVALSTEPPVQELIAAVHRNSAASGLLVQAVGSKCQDLKQPSFVCRLLRCLEGVHPSQSGALLMLLVPRLLGSPQLAPARQAGALACRRAELLLTLSEEEVHSQLTRADLDKVLESLHGSGLTNNLLVATKYNARIQLTCSYKYSAPESVVRRSNKNPLFTIKHSGLLILLHKLGNQFFDMAAADADKSRAFSPASVRSIQVNKAWFLAHVRHRYAKWFTHVRHRCCQREYSGLESAQMLSKLDYDDILSVLSCKDFNPGILQDCFKLATQLTLQVGLFPTSPSSCGRTKVQGKLFPTSHTARLHYSLSPALGVSTLSKSIRKPRRITATPPASYQQRRPCRGWSPRCTEHPDCLFYNTWQTYGRYCPYLTR
uniref:Uncharacterized protein n=1 Tax=Timema douglasi TaxID=61478 RepID=A0A7R8VT42_TIMDO|nr:unnamed protein product [Timema douglasi]